MLTLRKNNPNTSRKSESVPFSRVCMGHGKPGKSRNLIISFSRPGKS